MNYWQQQNGNGSQLDPMNAWSQQAQPDAVTAPATQTQTLNPGTGNAFQRMLEKVQAAKAPATQTLNPGDAFRGDQGASDLLGKISRAQWEDWRGRFAPYISTLADMASDPGAARNAARMAKESVGTAFDSSRQGLDMQRQGMGVEISKQQRQSENRSSNLARKASMVSAGNEARMSAQDRQMSILAGGMGLQNIPDKVLN
jgi:hypothetical protein